MSATTIEQEYLTVTDIARDSGRELATVYNWLKYHRYLGYERVLGKTVVRRAEYEQFKREHPELMKKKGRGANDRGSTPGARP